MQENQRFVNFIVFSIMILWIWSFFVAPKLFPPKPQQKDVVKKDAAGNPLKDEVKSAEEKPASKNEKKKGELKEAKPAKLKEFPTRENITIGSNKPESGYRLFVKFDSRGAVISEIQLIDPRYRDLSRPGQPLSLIQPDKELLAKTLQTDVPAIDNQLFEYKTSLAKVNWELVKDEQSESSVTWRYVAPDGEVEVQKRFWVEKLAAAQPKLEYKAYGLGFELALKNLGEKPKVLKYEMYGPVGLPIENRDNTQKTRDVAVGFLNPGGSLSPKLVANTTLSDNQKKNRVEEWKTPLKYAGVDVQYFAALLIPQEDQNKSPYFNSTTMEFVDTPPADEKKDTKFRNATVLFTSNEMDVAGKGEVKQEFTLFAGPKRDDLLRPFGAERIVDYGWLSGSFYIPQTLLGLLSLFHKGLSFLPWPYGWSIILLTILVRSCMFPLSRKQTIAAQKMQELQPEIAILKEKYKNTPEKFVKAQNDLFKKHNCSPLQGCLPALIQLPIFLGLYHAFNISVEMRGAPFLWIDNLAAPDALFTFPFAIFGYKTFNLLPILTVCLFLVQQKMLMPPATTPETEMQQKVMFYMTIGMGFMFYQVPAGLCVYFIASSLWGLAERRLLPKKSSPPGTITQTTATSGRGNKIPVDLLPKPAK